VKFFVAEKNEQPFNYREKVDNLYMNTIVKEFILCGDKKRQNAFIPP